MSKGRHRGPRSWGVLPPTGRDIESLPSDFAIFSVRLFASGMALTILAVVLAVADHYIASDVFLWAITGVACALNLVGYAMTRYLPSARRHARAQAADNWIRQVQICRVGRLARREEDLMARITELHAEFEAEKMALEEIQEERIAQEKMMSFIRGMEKSPAMRAYMANPRNRLRVVPDSREESA